jgi:hypothetical protein
MVALFSSAFMVRFRLVIGVSLNIQEKQKTSVKETILPIQFLQEVTKKYDYKN